MSAHPRSLTEYKSIVKNQTAVVYASARWCIPCRKVAPVFEDLASKAPSSVAFLKVDVDDDEDIATFERIEAMPTFLFYRSGFLINTVKGADPTALLNAYNALVALE